MAFPSDVVKVKKRLQAPENCSDEKNLYLETLCKLTEPPEGSPLLADYQNMWRSIEKNSHPDDLKDEHWVICYLNAVRNASNFPIVIAGDDDADNRVNAGRTKAEQASWGLDIDCIFPEGFNDFNDIQVRAQCFPPL